MSTPFLVHPMDLPIIAGCARGLGDPAMAADLGTNVPYIKRRLRSLYLRTGARGAAHLVRLAYDAGLLDQLPHEPREWDVLTSYQGRILLGLADGLEYREIATRHGISVNTAKRTGARLYRNLGVKGSDPQRVAAHAVAIGYQQGHLRRAPTAAAA